MEEEPHFSRALAAFRIYSQPWMTKALPETPFLRYKLAEFRDDLFCFHFFTPDSDLAEMPCDQYFAVVVFGEDFERRGNELKREYAENPQHAGSTGIYVYLKEKYAVVFIGNKPTKAIETLTLGND